MFSSLLSGPSSSCSRRPPRSGSMIVLALFDLAFGKKKPTVVTVVTESDGEQIYPPSRAVRTRWRKEKPRAWRSGLK